MKYLIVAADDFGLTRSINEGIVKSYKEGIVTFLNIIPTGEAYDDALKDANSLNLKEIGAHLAITETIPLIDPAKIPSLVTKTNRFYSGYAAFFLKSLFKMIRAEDVYVELKAQLESLVKTGIKITSLSSHEYLHILPEILEIFVKLAKEYNIPTIRYPRESRAIPLFGFDKRYKAWALRYFNGKIKSILDDNNMAYTDHFLGFLDSGSLKEDRLTGMLSGIKEGVTELVSHPGFLGPEVLDRYKWHINCEDELSALTSSRTKRLLKDKGIRLAYSYKGLVSSGIISAIR